MSDFNYPPQTGPYKVVTPSGSNWKQHDTARLDISVGQPYHEGEKFLATVEWAKSRFASVIISVADTLQRYNMAFEQQLSMNEAKKAAYARGTEWIERNKSYIEMLPNFEISRWDQWLAHSEFDSALHAFYELYEKNDLFSRCIDANIQALWNRKTEYHPAYSPESFDRFFSLSKDYLLEEGAVFSLMFEEKQAVDIYPGSFLLMWKALEYKTPDQLKSVEKRCFTRIDFRQNKNCQKMKTAA